MHQQSLNPPYLYGGGGGGGFLKNHRRGEAQDFLVKIRGWVIDSSYRGLSIEVGVITAFHLLIKRQSCYHADTNQLICSASQLTGFYMMATLAFNELNKIQAFKAY